MSWSARLNRNTFLFIEVDQKHESARGVSHWLFISLSVLVIKTPEKDNNMSASMEKNQQDIKNCHMDNSIFAEVHFFSDTILIY